MKSERTLINEKSRDSVLRPSGKTSTVI